MAEPDMEQLQARLAEVEGLRRQDQQRRRECAENHIDKVVARRAYTEEMAKRRAAEALAASRLETLQNIWREAWINKADEVVPWLLPMIEAGISPPEEEG